MRERDWQIEKEFDSLRVKERIKRWSKREKEGRKEGVNVYKPVAWKTLQ